MTATNLRTPFYPLQTPISSANSSYSRYWTTARLNRRFDNSTVSLSNPFTSTSVVSQTTQTIQDTSQTRETSSSADSSSSSSSGGSTTTTSKEPKCSSFDAFQTCSTKGDYGKCLSTASPNSCGCEHGIKYLDCVEDALEKSKCHFFVGITDWSAWERTWVQEACSTPPSSVMTELKQPTTVEVSYATVPMVTLTSTPTSLLDLITLPPHIITATPTLTSLGAPLLFDSAGDANPCATPRYTLLHAGDIVFYAAFVGCGADKPECCPWEVATTTTELPLGSTEGGGAPAGDRFKVIVQGGPGQLPLPKDLAKEGKLERCPGDYYTVRGEGICCPNGYFKFTRTIASQTACFSSLKDAATPPPVTSGLAANPTDTLLPTSAILNLAWAMAFNTTQDNDDPPVSTGAAVGIGIAAALVLFSFVGLLLFWFLRRRRHQRLARGEIPPTREKEANRLTGATIHSNMQFRPYSEGPPRLEIRSVSRGMPTITVSPYDDQMQAHRDHDIYPYRDHVTEGMTYTRGYHAPPTASVSTPSSPPSHYSAPSPPISPPPQDIGIGTVPGAEQKGSYWTETEENMGSYWARKRDYQIHDQTLPPRRTSSR